MDVLIRTKMLTFHYYLHLIYQAANNVVSLRDSHLRLLDSESIEPIEHGFNFLLSQKSFCVFLCHKVSGGYY